MVWKRKINRRYLKKNFSGVHNYSIVRTLRKTHDITPEFETLISMISLEDLIALKLELAARSSGGHLYGLPIWKSFPHIAKEACLKFAYSVCYSKSDVARFLGISPQEAENAAINYNIKDFFKILAKGENKKDGK